jgi:hypothetical protein
VQGFLKKSRFFFALLKAKYTLNSSIFQGILLFQKTLCKNQVQMDQAGYTGFLSRCEKVLSGLAIIFGLFGLYFWRKGKKDC